MSLSTRRALRAKELKREDPLAAQLADLGSEDAEYVSMLNSLEDENYNIPKDSELRSISGYKTNISVINLDSSTRLIVREECEILVPKPLREKNAAHFALYSSWG